MSPTSTPTDLFRHLSLNPQMSPTSEEVKSKAAEIRDVLSSFDREILPGEYRLDIYNKLDRPLGSRLTMQSEWTVQQDLVATLLQWGSYDEQAFKVITQIQPLQTRTRLFHEKVNRRFQDIFHHYDILHGTVQTSHEAHDQVQALAGNFVAVVNAVHEDRWYRELGQSRTAELVLGALIGVCSRHDDIMLSDFNSPASDRSSTISGLPRSDISLFQVLIRDVDHSQRGGFLILNLLDSYPPEIIGQQRSELQHLGGLLNSNGAPTAFIERASRLLEIAEEHAVPEEPEETEEQDEVPESSSSTKPGRRAAAAKTAESGATGTATTQARAGSKRSAATEASSKRGRKKTSK